MARTLVSSWQANEHGVDVLLARERYARLHDLLSSGRMKVRVVPRDADNVFVHGKAGVIEHADGRTSFLRWQPERQRLGPPPRLRNPLGRR